MNNHRALLTTTIVLLFLCPAITTQAAPGDLDQTFGNAGKVRVAGGGAMDAGFAVARQTDGKIIVAGQSQYSTGTDDFRFSLARFNANGSLDPTFGVNGVVETTIAAAPGGVSNLTKIVALAVLPDRKILAAGTVGALDGQNLTNDFVLLKYDANGTLDPLFGNGGKVLTDLGGSEILKGMAVQTDGQKIVLVGNSFGSGGVIAIARYNSGDGSLDTTFDGDGKRQVNIASSDVSVSAVRLQGTKIVVAGKVNFSGDVLLLRLNPDGALDNSFDFDGIVTTADADNSEPLAMTFMATTAGSDTIVLAGYSGPFGAPVAAVWRYNLADGSVDTTFGTGGKAVVPQSNSQATAIGLQTSAGVANRIIISGTAGNNVMVARFSLTGALDPAFDGDGIVTTDINFNGGSNSSAGPSAAMLIQPTDNKIVIAGTFSNLSVSADSDYAVLRYNANGTLDTTFDGDGLRIQDVGNVTIGARAVAVGPNGKIAVAGDGLVVCFHPDGSLDTSFNGSGKLRIARSIPALGAAAVAIQLDGKIVVTGSFRDGPIFSVLFVARFNSDGSPDTTFDGDGWARWDDGAGHAVAIQSDGKIVVAGETKTENNRNFTVYRFNPDGTRDTSFDGDGKVVTLLGGNFDGANAVALRSDGRIVAAGYLSLPNETDFATVVYNPDSSLDNSFSDDGVSVVRISAGAFARVTSVAVQDGRILVAGQSDVFNPPHSQIVLLRYNDNGLADSSFGNGGRLTIDGASFFLANGVTLQPDGKILLATSESGSAATFYDFKVRRFQVNGALDTSYGINGEVAVDFSGRNDLASAITIDSSARAIVVGDADGFFGAARLLGDAAIDPSPTPPPSPTPAPAPGVLGNISTRLPVLGGDNVLIAGMIATGNTPKKVIIRAIGPTLTDFGVPGALSDPTLELFQGNTPVASNDDWRVSSQGAEIERSGLAPGKDAEAAIIALLNPGENYTAAVRGKNGETGVALVEVFDLDTGATSTLGNISTRGFVGVDDNVMIAGVIVTPPNGSGAKILVRSLGPTLTDFGVSGALANPTLDLVTASGTVIRSSDDWKTSQEAAIQATGLAPVHDEEAALIETVPPGQYTAVVRGSGGGTGVGLVEVYNIQ